MYKELFLYFIIILGLLARSRVVALSGLALLIIKQLDLITLSEFLSNKGIEIGLIFLLMAIMAPMLINPLGWQDIKHMLTNWKVLVAIVAGILATQFNGMGLQLLDKMPQLVIGIVIGALIGIVAFGGIPVGPLMAAGIAAIIIEGLSLIFKILG